MTKPSDRPPAFLDTDVARYEMDMLRSTIPVYEHDTEAEKQARGDAAVAALVAMRPRDAFEASLASMAIAARHAADDCYYRAKLPGTSLKIANSLCRVANSLMRTVAGAVRDLAAKQARPLGTPPKFTLGLLECAKELAAERLAKAKPPVIESVPPPAPRKVTTGRHPEFGYLH